MHAIKLKTVIDRTHRLQIDLPPDTPEGEAEVIVLLASGLSPAGGPQPADVTVAPMDSLRAFLRDLDSRPLAQPRSAAEIEAQIADTRAGWD